MEDCGNQVAVLDIHILESISLLFSVKLVEECLFKVDSFDVQNGNEAFVVSLVAQLMVEVAV